MINENSLVVIRLNRMKYFLPTTVNWNDRHWLFLFKVFPFKFLNLAFASVFFFYGGSASRCKTSRFFQEQLFAIAACFFAITAFYPVFFTACFFAITAFYPVFLFAVHKSTSCNLVLLIQRYCNVHLSLLEIIYTICRLICCQ